MGGLTVHEGICRSVGGVSMRCHRFPAGSMVVWHRMTGRGKDVPKTCCTRRTPVQRGPPLPPFEGGDIGAVVPPAGVVARLRAGVSTVGAVVAGVLAFGPTMSLRVDPPASTTGQRRRTRHTPQQSRGTHRRWQRCRRTQGGVSASSRLVRSSGGTPEVGGDAAAEDPYAQHWATHTDHRSRCQSAI